MVAMGRSARRTGTAKLGGNEGSSTSGRSRRSEATSVTAVVLVGAGMALGLSGHAWHGDESQPVVTPAGRRAARARPPGCP
jgi:hypothetical protein